MWLDNDRNLEDMVETIIERDPDIVLLLGDYVYHSVENHEEEMEKVVSYLKPLAETDIPVFASLGNHDYSMSEKDGNPNIETAERVIRKLGMIGIEVLQNESVPVTLGETEEPLYLVGIGARWPEKDHLEEAYEELEEKAPRFSFMHNPNTFVKIEANHAPVAVAGHTHGGQIRIPFTPHWSWKNLIVEGEAHMDGWIEEDYGAEGNHLYVNRGIGVSIAPIRINNFPEITEFTLQQG
ncbi:metallophosphoesterase [Halobacillus amylolyticus]|uniref:Metallophosphoesterase n=1 Tax=Halobacillus amylolyticus TaxID=2932259 RepID=A0ABY4H7P2_9BACI|nr:metallophosphoesterase [Halobacillus amylolyticus]UOR10884.1 metallophosphoesterase [Halobacillus amylolyticus]